MAYIQNNGTRKIDSTPLPGMDTVCEDYLLWYLASQAPCLSSMSTWHISNMPDVYVSNLFRHGLFSLKNTITGDKFNFMLNVDYFLAVINVECEDVKAHFSMRDTL